MRERKSRSSGSPRGGSWARPREAKLSSKALRSRQGRRHQGEAEEIKKKIEAAGGVIEIK